MKSMMFSRCIADADFTENSSARNRLLVLRYSHWTVATPMIVFLISRLSDYSMRRILLVCSAQSVVILTGFLALVVPTKYECK